jgi:hypothetical protein
LQRNPYRREKIIKKIYGKTKEERKASLSKINAELELHYKQVDEKIAQAEIHQKPDPEIVKRRQEIAKRRAKLGFNDGGATEMDDPTIDKIEYLKKLNRISVTE